MTTQTPAPRKAGRRIPPGIFMLLLAGIVAALIWLSPEYLTNTIRYPEFVISEMQSSNWSSLADGDGDFSDWIEIYNPGNEARSLTGYYLTDDFKAMTKWQFPDIQLEGRSYLVVFASGKNRNQVVGDLHTNFRLAEQGEYLALIAPDGTSVVHEFLPKFPRIAGDDSLGLRESYFDASLVRMPGAERNTALYDFPTPGLPNAGEIWGQVSDTHFSQKGGLYQDPFELTLDTDTPQAIIRYTIDGSEPSVNNGELYRGPLKIDQTTTLRVRAFRDHYKPSNVDTLTYVFPSELLTRQGSELPGQWGKSADWIAPADYELDPEFMAESGTDEALIQSLSALPVVSLVMDPGALFGSENGIYGNPQQRGRDWERAGSFEIQFSQGKDGARKDCGIRIDGALSRDPKESPKHSFLLSFREQYGGGAFSYRLFGKPGPREFKSLRLQAGFENSWIGWKGEARAKADLLKGAWIQKALGDMGYPAGRGRYVHLLLNGHYWGIYRLTEDTDADAVATWLGGAGDDYETRDYQGNVEGDLGAWRELFDRSDRDLSDEATFAGIEALLSIDGFIDFMLVHIYGGAWDWGQGTQWFAARSQAESVPFYFFTRYDENALGDVNANVTGVDAENSPMRLFLRLSKSPLFQERFRARAEKLLGEQGALGRGEALRRYEALVEELRPAIQLEAARWGDYRRDVHPYRTGPFERYLPVHWESEVKRMTESYFPVRTDKVREQLQALGLY